MRNEIVSGADSLVISKEPIGCLKQISPFEMGMIEMDTSGLDEKSELLEETTRI